MARNGVRRILRELRDWDVPIHRAEVMEGGEVVRVAVPHDTPVFSNELGRRVIPKTNLIWLFFKTGRSVGFPVLPLPVKRRKRHCR